MKNIEEIFELLFKDNLTESERDSVSKALETNPEFKKYQTIFMALKNSEGHLSIDLISDHVLHSAGQEPNTAYFDQLKPIIIEHLSSCEKCGEQVELLSKEYGSIDEFINNEISGDRVIKTDEKIKRNISNFFLNPFPKYSIAGAFGIASIYFVLLMFSQFTTPRYLNLARLSNLETIETTRGRTTESFIKGMEALEVEQFELAILHFQTDIDQSLSESTLFYTHYILGLVYINKSESDFAGLFPSNNEVDLNMAIKNLKHSVNKNNSGSFDNIKLNSYYFLGKANILREKFGAAKEYLDKVISAKGPYYLEAVTLLSALEQKP